MQLPPPSLLAGFGLRLVLLPAGADIPGTYWGAPEAGLSGDQLFVRPDTPVHSVLHEAAHFLCMPPSAAPACTGTRAATWPRRTPSATCRSCWERSSGAAGWSRERLFADMDAWGYSFRLGSTRRWFEEDADEALAWLRDRGLVHVTGNAIRQLPRKN